MKNLLYEQMEPCQSVFVQMLDQAIRMNKSIACTYKDGCDPLSIYLKFDHEDIEIIASFGFLIDFIKINFLQIKSSKYGAIEFSDGFKYYDVRIDDKPRMLLYAMWTRDFIKISHRPTRLIVYNKNDINVYYPLY
jgi:hypothetical protein